MLIDSDSTSKNFIHYKLDKALNWFIYLAPYFQVMIADGGTMNFLGKCHKITLTMGEYLLNRPMIAITIESVDVVLGVKWLQSFGTVTFNFLELFMKVSLEKKRV